MTAAAELADILEAHRKWRFGEPGGSRADLARADLAGANLAGADLADAYLADANLAGADLARAYLAGAYLAGADLADANLADANLAGADLAGADLAGANLAGANLAGANLAGANLARAYLAGANLAGADLARAYLAGAYLAGADLADANLAGANLAGADLAEIRDDILRVLKSAPAEVPGLLLAVREGRVDGSVYTGECACLLGTIANVRGCDAFSLGGGLRPNSARPAERFFLAIRTGDTPTTSQVSAIVEGWIVEWQAKQPPAALAEAK